MKKNILSIFIFSVVLSFGQTMTNADFTTDVATLPNGSPGTGAGWYGNANITITGGEARLTFNDAGSSFIRQDVAFATSGIYELSYDIKATETPLLKNTYTTLRDPLGGSFTEDHWLWVAGSESSSDVVIGASDKNMQSKKAAIGTNFVTHKANFSILSDNTVYSIYLSCNKLSGTAGGYISLDNITLTYKSALSVEDLKQFNFVSHPNPVKDVLNLSAQKPIDKVEFYSLLGQIVLSQEVDSRQDNVSVSHLNTGIYIAKVFIGEAIGTYKFIKE